MKSSLRERGRRVGLLVLSKYVLSSLHAPLKFPVNPDVAGSIPRSGLFLLLFLLLQFYDAGSNPPSGFFLCHVYF